MPSARKRIAAMDVLRGFALFGIFVVNLPFLAHPISAQFDPNLQPIADRVASFVDSLLFQGKFFLLFSFLFGTGFAAMLTQTSEDEVRGKFFRRLLGLFLFGVLDAVFLFVGDILVSYALLGLLLWPLRHWEPRRLLKFSVGMLCVAAICQGILALFYFGSFDAVQMKQWAAEATRNYRGNFLQATGQRVHDLAIFYTFTPLFNWPSIVAMFALGLAAGKSQFFRNLASWLPRLGRVVGKVLPFALIGNALFALLPNNFWAVPVLMTFPFASCALSFCYLWAVLTLAERGHLLWLAAPGRMSLSNYLGQALIASTLFCGWGLGWFGKLGSLSLFGVAITVFAVQIVLSHLWQRHFQYGVDEWLLRSFIHRKWQPLRVAATDT